MFSFGLTSVISKVFAPNFEHAFVCWKSMACIYPSSLRMGGREREVKNLEKYLLGGGQKSLFWWEVILLGGYVILK